MLRQAGALHAPVMARPNVSSSRYQPALALRMLRLMGLSSVSRSRMRSMYAAIFSSDQASKSTYPRLSPKSAREITTRNEPVAGFEGLGSRSGLVTFIFATS